MKGRPALSLRLATRTDASAIAAIYNEAVRTTVATFDTEPRSLRDQEAWLEHHGARHPVIVAERDGRVLGWASLSPWSERKAYDGTAEVSLYVVSEHRGEGIGRALLEELLRRGEKAGLHTLLARIAGGNEVSLHLHMALGFTPVGVMREVGRKLDRWVDVHVLERVYGPPVPNDPR